MLIEFSRYFKHIVSGFNFIQAMFVFNPEEYYAVTFANVFIGLNHICRIHARACGIDHVIFRQPFSKPQLNLRAFFGFQFQPCPTGKVLSHVIYINSRLGIADFNRFNGFYFLAVPNISGIVVQLVQTACNKNLISSLHLVAFG